MTELWHSAKISISPRLTPTTVFKLMLGTAWRDITIISWEQVTNTWCSSLYSTKIPCSIKLGPYSHLCSIADHCESFCCFKPLWPWMKVKVIQNGKNSWFLWSLSLYQALTATSSKTIDCKPTFHGFGVGWVFFVQIITQIRVSPLNSDCVTSNNYEFQHTPKNFDNIPNLILLDREPRGVEEDGCKIYSGTPTAG